MRANKSKYDNQGMGFIIGAIITIVTLSFAGILILRSFAKPTYTFSGNELTVSGQYQVTIDLSGANISHELSRIPSPETRTNGAAIGGIQKGYFRLDGLKVYLNIMDNTAENYILIIDRNNGRYYINCKTPEETNALYEEIASRVISA